MKKITFTLFATMVAFISFAGDILTLKNEMVFEGKVIKIYSDTLNTRIVYNLTGYESVGYAVLNVIALYDDGTESRKEFKVLEYKTKQNITEVLIATEQGEMKYIFNHDEYILITQDGKNNIMWEGDIIF